MTIGFNLAIMLKKRKQSRCERCCLLHDNSLCTCPHCSSLMGDQLLDYKLKNQKKVHNMGKFFIVLSLFLFFCLLISFFLYG